MCKMAGFRFPPQRDQLEMVTSETRSLLSQLEAVRKEKHLVEEARARGAKQRDTKVHTVTHFLFKKNQSAKFRHVYSNAGKCLNVALNHAFFSQFKNIK